MSLDETVAELLERHGVPGAAIGIVEPDAAPTVLAIGQRGDRLGSVTADTVFAAASLTKPIFATAVMTLVDDGTLDLDKPLSAYGADLWLAGDPRAESITARMALSHTTGLPNWRDQAPLSIRWEPGTRWGYSGEGLAYLWSVVARLVNVGIDQFVDNAVLAPLGMRDSSFGFRDDFADRFAVQHDSKGQALERSVWPEFKAPAGALYTTARDYATFLAHSLANNNRMFEEQARIDDALAWGLGWGIEETTDARSVWQWGSDPGAKNFVIGRPSDRRGVVVFTNGDAGEPVYTEIVRAVMPGAHPSLEANSRAAWLLSFGSG